VRASLSAFLLTLAVAALSLVFGAGEAWAAFPGSNGRIAFAVEKWRPADPCLPDPHGCEPELVSSTIETVLPSGRGRRVLYSFGTRTLASESGPAWSPSGRLLALQQAGRLAVIRRDGTPLRQLPRLTAWDSEPAWSPDGRRLAFTGSPNWLFTVRPDGTGLRRVVTQTAFSPSWSVNGQIAFAHLQDRYSPASVRDGLYTVRPDGSRLRRLFGRYRNPDWSPDGTRIAIQGYGQVYTLGADGRGLRRRTAFKQERVLTGPVWSPDGRYIAFGRVYDLYVMRASGRGLRRIVDAPSLGDVDQPDHPWSEVSEPAWQPLP
jgi:Tol biopolymer transport system component